jgi:universal stress protein A
MKTIERTTVDRLEGKSAAAPKKMALKLKRIMVPIDFSKASINALKYAIPFAEESGASLYLVHVVEPASFLNDLPSVALAKPDEAVAKAAKEKLVALANEEIEELIPVYPQIRIGRAYEEITVLAKSLNVDLIIIATHGYTGLKHAFLGSTAERVVRCAPCPVLVVRAKGREFIN